MDKAMQVLKGYFNHLEEDGFVLNIKTIQMLEVNRQYNRLMLYFNVHSKGRPKEEIDMLARLHKVELYLITGVPELGILYNIVD